MMRLKRSVMAIGLAIGLMSVVPGLMLTAAASNGGAPPAKPVDLVWANDELWDSTVLGPLHGSPKPHTLDAFFLVPGQNPVSDAAPGDKEYNGGRWLPTMLSWVGAGAQPLFTDGEDVQAAIDTGDFVVLGTGTPFLCPLTNPNNSG